MPPFLTVHGGVACYTVGMFNTSVSFVLGVRRADGVHVLRCRRTDGEYDIPGGLISPPQTVVSGIADRLRCEVGVDAALADSLAERAQYVCTSVNYTTGTVSLVHAVLLDEDNPLVSELDHTPLADLNPAESAGAEWVPSEKVAATIMEPLRERVAYAVESLTGQPDRPKLFVVE